MSLLKRFMPVAFGLLIVALVVMNGLGLFRQTPTPASVITLTFWTLQLRDFAPLIESWISEYEDTHPNQRINWVDVPFSEGEKRALTAMLSPNIPDVINLNPAFSSTLAERNVLATFAPSELEAYHPALLGTLKTTTGQTFALPWYTTVKLHFYNNRLVNEAQASTLVQTKQPDAKTLARLKRLNAYAMYPLYATGGNTLKALQQLSPQGYKSDQALTDSLETVLYPVLKGIKEGWIPNEVVTGQYSNTLELYMAGRLALLEAGSSALNTIKNNAPDVYKHTRLLPVYTIAEQSGLTDASPMVLVVPVKSKHPVEAKAFARFITQTRFQLELMEKAPVLPSTTTGLTVLSKQQGSSLEAAALQAGAVRLLQARGILPIYPHQAALNDASNAVAQAYMLNQPSLLHQQLTKLHPVLFK